MWAKCCQKYWAAQPQLVLSAKFTFLFPDKRKVFQFCDKYVKECQTIQWEDYKGGDSNFTVQYEQFPQVGWGYPRCDSVLRISPSTFSTPRISLFHWSTLKITPSRCRGNLLRSVPCIKKEWLLFVFWCQTVDKQLSYRS